MFDPSLIADATLVLVDADARCSAICIDDQQRMLNNPIASNAIFDEHESEPEGGEQIMQRPQSSCLASFLKKVFAFGAVAAASTCAMPLTADEQAGGDLECLVLEAITLSDGVTGVDGYGLSVDADDDWIVVGAPSFDPEDGAIIDGGAVMIFQRNAEAWVHTQTLHAPAPANHDKFGHALDLHGTALLVGAPGVDGDGLDQGAAFVFALDEDGMTWSFDSQLEQPSPSNFDSYGWDVALDGELAAVGAVGWEPKGGTLDDDHGAVFMFRHLGLPGKGGGGFLWKFDQLIPNPDQPENAILDRFGVAIDMRFGVLVVGAYLDDVEGGPAGDLTDTGAAWAFDLFGSIEDAQKLVTDPSPAGFSGLAVATNGSWIFVGSPRANDGAGRVDVYGRIKKVDGGIDEWVPLQQFAAPIPDGEPEFGRSLATSENTLVIGAPYEMDSGTCYVKTESGFAWSDHTTLQASMPDPEGPRLGIAVAITPGDFVVAGAALADASGIVDGGAALVFDYTEPDCNDNGIPDDCDIDSGFSADCDENELPDECDIDADPDRDCNDNGELDECEPCLADIAFDDGEVNLADFILLILNWGTDGAGSWLAPPCDNVDINDVIAMILQWGVCEDQMDTAR